jgi:hypothetical protein
MSSMVTADQKLDYFVKFRRVFDRQLGSLALKYRPRHLSYINFDQLLTNQPKSELPRYWQMYP